MEHVRDSLGRQKVSQRRACRVLGQSRATQRRRAHVPGAEVHLSNAGATRRAVPLTIERIGELS